MEKRGKRSSGEIGAPPAARITPLWPWAAFGVLLAIFAVTLAPDVVGGDSGELTASGASGGVPHPPGYPLFAILARVFAALPFGPSIAWRVNLVSALATAGAAALLCAAARRWTGSALAGLLAAALFGLDALVWRHATAAEVFGLNALFVAATALLWIRAESAGRDVSPLLFYAMAFVAGLAMSNHHTYVFIGLPLLGRVAWLARQGMGVRGIAFAAAAGLAGLLPYAYLPLASASDAAVSWGDQTSPSGFLFHLLRREYGTFALGQQSDSNSAFVSSGTFFPTLGLMLGGMLQRLHGVGLPLAAAAMVLGTGGPAARRSGAAGRGPSARLLGGVILIYAFVFASLSNVSLAQPLYVTVLSRFFIQADALAALLGAVGAAEVARHMRQRSAARSTVPRSATEAASRVGPLAVVAGLALAAVAVSTARTLLRRPYEVAQRGNTVFRDFLERAFAGVPPNAIVVTMGDHVTGAIMYRHGVERLRPDIVHLDRELLGFPWYAPRVRRRHPGVIIPEGLYFPGGWNIRQLMQANPTRPVIVIDRLKPWDQSWKDGHKLVTLGLVFWMAPVAQAWSYERWLEHDRKLIKGFDPMPALRHPEGSWERELGLLALQMQAHRAHQALIYAHEMGKAAAPARYAADLLESGIAMGGGNAAFGIPSAPGIVPFEVHHTAWKDLGLAYEIMARADPRLIPRAVAAFDLYLPRASKDDPDVDQIRRYVEGHKAMNPGMKL